jgi:hypothetical protein
MNKLLVRLLRLVRDGLETTAPLWPPIQAAYTYVHRAAHLLANADALDRLALQQRYGELLAELQVAQAQLGPLALAAAHFLKVTASYWPGLFACYAVADLPPTDNGLEQYFGRARHAERRATGRKSASPALVVRGAVRVVAAVATQRHPFTAAELCPADAVAWRTLRQQVTARHDARRLQARFRRDPDAYLAVLEQRLVAKPALPSKKPKFRPK